MDSFSVSGVIILDLFKQLLCQKRSTILCTRQLKEAELLCDKHSVVVNSDFNSFTTWREMQLSDSRLQRYNRLCDKKHWSQRRISFSPLEESCNYSVTIKPGKTLTIRKYASSLSHGSFSMNTCTGVHPSARKTIMCSYYWVMSEWWVK